MSAVTLRVVAEVCLFSLALRRERTITLRIGGALPALLYIGAMVVVQEPPFDPVALLLRVWTTAVIAARLFFRTNNDYVRALWAHSHSASAY